MQADYYINICSILQLELHGYLPEENPEIYVYMTVTHRYCNCAFNTYNVGILLFKHRYFNYTSKLHPIELYTGVTKLHKATFCSWLLILYILQ